MFVTSLKSVKRGQCSLNHLAPPFQGGRLLAVSAEGVTRLIKVELKPERVGDTSVIVTRKMRA